MHRIGEWMAPGSDDLCRVLFVQGANPMVMCPDTVAVRAAFERADVFTVVHEQVLTDTARYADIVLPATTSFELDDVAWSYGATAVLPVRAAIAPVGESWSNDQVGLGIARAYGFDWTLPAVPLPAEPIVVALPTLQFVDTHHTVHLADPVHGVPVFTPTDPGFAVLSPSSTKMINSIFGEFADQAADVQMHPADAERFGLVDGAAAELVSSTGVVVSAPVRVTSSVREGVLVMPKGVWLRNHRDGLGVNALTPSSGDPVTDGACFNDARVQVRVAAPR
jgi:anaerobic selenocysteine-containing dehydrogenase